jgi:aspartyl-tRNA(Asn)/glutamyl-tRNA(Gln) amidotransferase subunit A
VSVKGTSSAEYINAKNEMEENRQTISKLLFEKNDVLISPTIIATAPCIAEAGKSGSFDLGYTLPFSYYGVPAITLPCGFGDKGLPLGLQIVGPRWGEAKVLSAALSYQKATKWHLKHPDIA